jgi:tetratricopeptide (TPR) repeat protein
VYLHVGLTEQGREEFTRSLRLNPYKAWHAGSKVGAAPGEFIAWSYLLEHRYDRALAENDRTASMALPHLASALLYLGRDAEARRRIDDGLAALAKAPASRHETAPLLALRAVLHARAGNAAKAEEDIAAAIRVGQGWNHFHHTEYSIACAYAVMGRTPAALEWLKRTVADGFASYPYFENDPLLERVKGEPAFQDLMQRTRARGAS